MPREKESSLWEPDYAVVPGDTLQETIDELGMTQRELASRTGLTGKTINRIIKGKDPITADTACKLEIATGVPASLWNNLERHFREQKARLEQRNRLANSYEWVKQTFPIAELRRRGLISASSAQVDVVESVLKFFGTASPEAWEKANANALALFRRSKRLVARHGVATTWLRLAEIEAHKVACEQFSAERFREALDRIRPLVRVQKPGFDEQMQSECASAGVALVFVPEFKGGGINGATRWLSPDRAMIALSIRGRFADIFWFTFFHKAAHVLKHNKKCLFVEAGGASSDVAELEQEANQFASDFLVPRSEQSQLLKLKTSQAITAFARKHGVHPGIIVGQLAHRDPRAYSRFAELRTKFEWAEEP